jgi:mutator protein MutT
MSTPDDEPIPVGIGIIRRGDCFLVRQRPQGTVYAGFWEFPGGNCHLGEDPARATARECFEEIGLAVVVGRLRRVVTHRYPHGLVKLHFYDCTTEQPTAEPMEGAGFHWLLASELAELRFPEANDAIIGELASEPRQGIGLGCSGIGGSRSTTLSINP